MLSHDQHCACLCACHRAKLEEMEADPTAYHRDWGDIPDSFINSDKYDKESSFFGNNPESYDGPNKGNWKMPPRLKAFPQNMHMMEMDGGVSFMMQLSWAVGGGWAHASGATGFVLDANSIYGTIGAQGGDGCVGGTGDSRFSHSLAGCGGNGCLHVMLVDVAQLAPPLSLTLAPFLT